MCWSSDRISTPYSGLLINVAVIHGSHDNTITWLQRQVMISDPRPTMRPAQFIHSSPQGSDSGPPASRRSRWFQAGPGGGARQDQEVVPGGWTTVLPGPTLRAGSSSGSSSGSSTPFT